MTDVARIYCVQSRSAPGNPARSGGRTLLNESDTRARQLRLERSPHIASLDPPFASPLSQGAGGIISPDSAIWETTRRCAAALP